MDRALGAFLAARPVAARGAARDAVTAGDAAAPPSRTPRLGVLVPCRDEALVIGRKLGNLAAAAWPAGAAHRVLVVDDGSVDDTAARARSRCASLFAEGTDARVTAAVLVNPGPSGKAGAIRAGLAVLDDVDVIVLTDADVIFEREALAAVADAFTRDEALGMACGAQRFVASLSDDGRTRAADGGPLVDAAGRYDRWTSRVRAFESRRGLLFSVHGQLLAWRADLGLRPTPGIAADDLELMLQVRTRGLTVRRLARARFVEVKTPPGAGRREQALRRARAYVQLVRAVRPTGLRPAARLQWWLYRFVPTNAPWLAALAAVGTVALAAWLGGPVAAGLAVVTLAALASSPPGRAAVRLLVVIARAVRTERRDTLSDRWEMTRDAPASSPRGRAGPAA